MSHWHILFSLLLMQILTWRKKIIFSFLFKRYMIYFASNNLFFLSYRKNIRTSADIQLIQLKNCLGFRLLILNWFDTFFMCPVVDLEDVNAGWINMHFQGTLIKCYNRSYFITFVTSLVKSQQCKNFVHSCSVIKFVF